ncbi:MAG: ATP-binding protein [Candidatus Cloacimonadota bacterium]|nr:ATP-binding protein [Candidatus Cloacimonadota bacterium]
MYIAQKQLENIRRYMFSDKVIVIYGARRTGKTTLLKRIVEDLDEKYLFLSGEDIITKEYLESQSIEKLKSFVKDNKVLFIDEAQNIKNVGLNLKLIVDHIPDIQIIATGSSSFDLAQNIGEPLTGRKFTFLMYPLSQLELSKKESIIQTKGNLESRLIFGSYPEIILAENIEEKRMLLKEIVSSYLFKDILELEGIKKSDKVMRMLQLIAFQIGKEVSYQEIGRQLGISKNTVEKYLDLLEKSFVIKKIVGFSRNLRKEISKNPRYYFLDNGIRNALINNFNPINLRNDIGQLWENYLVMERLKKQEYTFVQQNIYFWRTYDKKEIDLIEEREGKLFGYEIKWSNKTKRNSSKLWLSSYSNAEFKIINRENYLEFIE